MSNGFRNISYRAPEPTEKADRLVILNLNTGATNHLINHAYSVGRSLLFCEQLAWRLTSIAYCVFPDSTLVQNQIDYCSTSGGHGNHIALSQVAVESPHSA